MVVNHQVAIQPTPFFMMMLQACSACLFLNGEQFSVLKKPKATVRKSFTMSKTHFSLLCDIVSYLFYNSWGVMGELGHGGINSNPIAEVVVVRLDQHK